MRIQIVSDLHLEFSDVFIKNTGNTDVLILSGDILVAEKLMRPDSESGKRFRNFLSRCSNEFPHVVYVAGNHEFYGSGKFYGSIDDLRSYCLNHSNIYFLERDYKIINDVVFIGATLWTDMNKSDPLTLHSIKDMMNDYRAILNDRDGFRYLQPTDTVKRHKDTLEFFNTILNEYRDKKCVVVGHHTPTSMSIDPEYNNDRISNGAYHSDLSEFILNHPQIKLWTCGHTHHAHQYNVGETLVVCNPRGYETSKFCQETGFDPQLVIDLDKLESIKIK